VTASEPSPKKVGDLGPDKFRAELSASGLGIQIGPFAALIQAVADELDSPMHQLYADYPLLPIDSIFSFHVRLDQIRKLPRFKRLVRFSVDGRVPHEDMPADQALAVLEWGINLVIALRSHCFLMLHSAVLERNGSAILLPAEPGHGKTTLCAGLAHRGWRLLSDEFGLIRPATGELVSIPRPMALKNESIDVIRSFAPEAVIGPSIPNTRKGTVAHVKPPAMSVQQQSIGAAVRWIVFPRWIAGAPMSLEKLPEAEAFMMLATNAFNYELLGEAAFVAVRNLIAGGDCYRLVYSDLDEVTAYLGELAAKDEPK
jgi:HprK-related kinase A